MNLIFQINCFKFNVQGHQTLMPVRFKLINYQGNYDIK